MSWKFWKEPEERVQEEWEKAVSLRNQAEWREASEHFLKAAELAEEVSDPQLRKQGSIARALAALYRAVAEKTAESLRECHRLFSELDPETTLKIPYEVKASEVAEEAKILAEEFSLPQIDLSRLDEYPSELADRYEALSQLYLGLGREELVLSDLFQMEESVFKAASKHLGFSGLLKGKAEERRDPGKAVEYYAEAMGNFSQAMIEEYKSYVDERSQKLSSVAKCWFCGRDIQGEEVHYLYLETVLTPYLYSRFGAGSPPSVKGSSIAACLACYKAIHILAGMVAQVYYEKAMAAIREVESRLLVMISDLSRRLAAVEGLRLRTNTWSR